MATTTTTKALIAIVATCAVIASAEEPRHHHPTFRHHQKRVGHARPIHHPSHHGNQTRPVHPPFRHGNHTRPVHHHPFHHGNHTRPVHHHPFHHGNHTRPTNHTRHTPPRGLFEEDEEDLMSLRSARKIAASQRQVARQAAAIKHQKLMDEDVDEDVDEEDLMAFKDLKKAKDAKKIAYLKRQEAKEGMVTKTWNSVTSWFKSAPKRDYVQETKEQIDHIEQLLDEMAAMEEEEEEEEQDAEAEQWANKRHLIDSHIFLDEDEAQWSPTRLTPVKFYDEEADAEEEAQWRIESNGIAARPQWRREAHNFRP